jgi:hypothetical protein
MSAIWDTNRVVVGTRKGRIILKLILKEQWEIVDWIHVAQIRDRWQAFVNTVMNLRIS